MLVKVESFIFLADFVILDCEVDFEMEKGQKKFRLNNEEATFNICRFMRQSGDSNRYILYPSKKR